MYLITTALLTAVAAWGLNIVSGFAGQISLAHGGSLVLEHMYQQFLEELEVLLLEAMNLIC